MFGHNHKDDLIAVLREQLAMERERVNRLTELLAQKSGFDLVLPRNDDASPVIQQQGPGSPAAGLAPAKNSWWDTMIRCGGHVVATPVSVPTSTKKESN